MFYPAANSACKSGLPVMYIVVQFIVFDIKMVPDPSGLKNSADMPDNLINFLIDVSESLDVIIHHHFSSILYGVDSAKFRILLQ